MRSALTITKDAGQCFAVSTAVHCQARQASGSMAAAVTLMNSIGHAVGVIERSPELW